MFCTKCGTKIEKGSFCPNCGAVVKANNTNTNTVSVPAPKKKSHVGLILGIVFGVLFLFIIGIVAVVLIFVSKASTNTVVEKGPKNYHLVCTASEGDITIDYNEEDGIIGYDAKGMTYDLEGQQKLADQYGVDVYMETFNTWFEGHTSGSCVVQDDSGDVVKEFTTKTDTDKDKDKDKTTTKTKIVGEDKYGYVEVPSNWVNFKDVDGGHQIQFSYGTTYIVTLDYVDNADYGTNLNAENLATSFLAKSKEDENLEGVTGATVTIGKDKEYTAYQVYMYYKNEGTYLVTYWFDAEDGYIHYIALEGPEGVTDYLSIPESFSLTK